MSPRTVPERIFVAPDAPLPLHTAARHVAGILDDMSPDERDKTIERIVTILNNRVNQYGLTEPTIRPLGDKRVEVELPGTTDPEVARRLIGRTALLEFQKVVESGSPGSSLSPSNLS